MVYRNSELLRMHITGGDNMDKEYVVEGDRTYIRGESIIHLDDEY